MLRCAVSQIMEIEIAKGLNAHEQKAGPFERYNKIPEK